MIETAFPSVLLLLLLSALFGVYSTSKESRYSLRVSQFLYALSLVMIAAIFFQRLWVQQQWLITHFFDGILLSIMILAMGYLILAIRFSLQVSPVFISTVSFLLGLVAFFFEPHVPADNLSGASFGLGFHTLFMFIALATFSASFIFSLLFLCQDFLIRKKKIGGWFNHLPPLELMTRLNISSLTLATGSLFAGVLVGLVQFKKLELAWGVLLEPAVLLSLTVLVVYLIILLVRIGFLEKGRRYAVVSVTAYLFLFLSLVTMRYGGGGLH